jgi:signal transduction histidine kinase/DNA-binding response OmpR family regulator
VYGILPDIDGNLWLSTNFGLCKFNLDENKNAVVENYTNRNGLQGLEFNTGAHFKDANGMLYFGGLEGINWFKPNQITTNTIQPQTVITGVDIFNEPVDFTEPLELEFNENTVTFTFSGLHFSQPERNQYKYKLVNNDKDWIEAGNTNIAHYTNLPSDNYEFQVYSSNYDGIWDTTPATYSFAVLKPWYINNLAKFLYLSLLVGLVVIIYRYLKFRWEVKTQLQLEHAETERLIKLDEFKTKLYTNISHEIRTPLTLISGPVEHQLERDHLTEIDKQELQLVKQNADRLLNLANQMMDLSLVESGQIKLKVSHGNLGMLLKQLLSAFEYKAKDKNIDLSYSVGEIEDAYFDKDIIEKVISNLVSNAIKYSPLDSAIVINAATLNEAFVFSIINNYDRVKRKDLSELFKRFYQEDVASEGIGVGLALVKELVTLSKGSIIANNIESDKIQFTITLPIGKKAFEATEISEILSEIEIAHNNLEEEMLMDSEEERPVVLIVEDELDILKFIASIFTLDYKVIEAENGEIAMSLAKQTLPDIIISDVMMPIKDGIALCNDLKKNEITSHIPIILLTAKVGEENEITGLETGADAYITKPFNSKKLQTRVTQLIENRKQLKQYYTKNFSISPELAKTSTETKFLKRLNTVLETHLTDSNFTSERFSELLLISRTQLHRKLKAITGQTTSEFIRTQRLKLAEQLLKQSDANVSEIAYQIGFNSPSYFSKCFKELYGSSPIDFIKTL